MRRFQRGSLGCGSFRRFRKLMPQSFSPGTGGSMAQQPSGPFSFDAEADVVVGELNKTKSAHLLF
jgi:hypothetical protein